MVSIPQFDLSFDRLDFENLRKPNIQIFYKITCNNGKEFRDNDFIKINNITFTTTITFLTKEYSTIEQLTLSDEYLHESYFSQLINMNIDANITIHFSREILDKIIYRNFNENKIELKIKVGMEFEFLQKNGNYYNLTNPYSSLSPYIHDSQREYGILLSEDLVTEIVAKNHGTEIISISIPIPMQEKCRIASLQNALVNLQLACEAYSKGNKGDFIINIRNTILNNLTELTNNSPGKSKGNSPTKKRILKQDIIEECLKQIPTSDLGSYKNILTNVSNIIRDLLKNINTFVHEDTGKIIKWPYPADMELIYFTTCLIIRYLFNISSYDLPVA